ncbi:M23 family metallopeptidase [Pelagibacterium montanilacus]|uniref:M23 family metallopeptidase n=1 Tax=Pelagibacterium montanilacus TaxID=2185280 RepID=UPI0013E09C7F|nr:M23 family metallopeptidase [Pelagibacterium montanilacus]
MTASASSQGVAASSQPMPGFVPPANIGGGAPGGPMIIDRSTAQPMGQQSGVVSQDLPPLQSSSVTSTQTMPAQTASAPQAQPLPSSPPPAQSSSPQLGVVSGDQYRHTIASGESLYTIARRYDVSATEIVSANNLDSPDRIRVGQQLVIPGRPDLLAQRGQETRVASASPANGVQQLSAPNGDTASVSASSAPAQSAPSGQPAEVASVPAQSQQPAAAPAESSATGNFRWPVSGRVITDFAASRGTGINIEAPEGTSVRAAETGEVIYVGNAVEGYGNLVLIRHSNGFVSAYAHLQNIGVVRGDSVTRGDAIGTVGTTGSVTRPQLHFEIRRGATPIDPMPHLAG